MQETWVPALVQEDPTCQGATKPVCHRHWDPEPGSCNYGALRPQLLKPMRPRTRALLQEKPLQREDRSCRATPSARLEKTNSSNEDPAQPKLGNLYMNNIVDLNSIVSMLASWMWLLYCGSVPLISCSFLWKYLALVYQKLDVKMVTALLKYSTSVIYLLILWPCPLPQHMLKSLNLFLISLPSALTTSAVFLYTNVIANYSNLSPWYAFSPNFL